MTGFRGVSGSGRIVEELTPETLQQLLNETESFVRVEDRRSNTEYFGEARRSEPGAWRVVVSDRTAGGLVATTARNADAVFDILRSWAAGDGWWAEAFAWKPVGR
jgi:hypothetical protein